MSYSLIPYSVDLSKIKASLGSQDESLLRFLSKKFENEFENIDALGDDYVDDVDDYDEEGEPKGDAPGGVKSVEEALLMLRDILLNQDSTPKETQDDRNINKDSNEEEQRPPCASTAEALQHLIMGEEFDRRVGFKYGYVLEKLCQHFGEALPNDNWCDLRSCHNWFEDLDNTLRIAGVPAETLSINRHLIGRGSPITIPKYRDFPSIGYLSAAEIESALEALSKAKIDDIGEEEEQEPWLPEGLDDVRSWLHATAESKHDLVCFYY